MTADIDSDSSDTLVIGAGTLGMMTALRLAQRGVEVTVLDSGAPMEEASGVNAGSLAAQNKMRALMPHTLAALALWRQMSEFLGADVGFANVGGLRVATSDSDLALLAQSSDEQSKLGVDIEWLDGAALAQRAPFIGKDVLAATYSSVDCYASPLLFTPALLRTAEAAGVRVHSRLRVVAVARSGTVYRVETEGGRVFRCGRLIIAAGAWSGSIARLMGVEIPVALDVNMISVSGPATSFMHGVVTHVQGILTLKQVANGTCLIGGGWQGAGSLESGRKDIDYESSLHNVRLAIRVIPHIRELTLVRQWAGFEGVSPDSCPYLGALPNHPNAYMLACARGGWTLSPILSQMLSELMLDRDTSLPYRNFSPARFCDA
ncbi:MAG: FAD-dependent oxidoreductase [Variovorax sp.]